MRGRNPSTGRSGSEGGYAYSPGSGCREFSDPGSVFLPLSGSESAINPCKE